MSILRWSSDPATAVRFASPPRGSRLRGGRLGQWDALPVPLQGEYEVARRGKRPHPVFRVETASTAATASVRDRGLLILILDGPTLSVVALRPSANSTPSSSCDMRSCGSPRGWNIRSNPTGARPSASGLQRPARRKEKPVEYPTRPSTRIAIASVRTATRRKVRLTPSSLSGGCSQSGCGVGGGSSRSGGGSKKAMDRLYPILQGRPRTTGLALRPPSTASDNECRADLAPCRRLPRMGRAGLEPATVGLKVPSSTS